MRLMSFIKSMTFFLGFISSTHISRCRHASILMIRGNIRIFYICPHTPYQFVVSLSTQQLQSFCLLANSGSYLHIQTFLIRIWQPGLNTQEDRFIYCMIISDTMKVAACLRQQQELFCPNCIIQVGSLCCGGSFCESDS